jgi:hypothetical protein
MPPEPVVDGLPDPDWLSGQAPQVVDYVRVQRMESWLGWLSP